MFTYNLPTESVFSTFDTSQVGEFKINFPINFNLLVLKFRNFKFLVRNLIILCLLFQNLNIMNFLCQDLKFSYFQCEEILN